MLRLSIITANTIDVLTVSGLLSFVDTYAIRLTKQIADLNKAFTLDTHFVNTFAGIQPCQGFDLTAKEALLQKLKYRVGQKCIITTGWLSKTNPTNTKYWHQIVEALNTDTPLSEQQLFFLQKHKIEYNHSTRFFN